MNEAAFIPAALASYGLAAIGHLAFAGHLALRWRRSVRATLLLAAVVATAVWAAASAAAVLRPGALPWLVASASDTLRYALWFAFADRILRSTSSREAALPPVVPRSVLIAAAAMLAGSFLLPLGIATAPGADPQVRLWAFGLRTGVAVIGLVMVEQIVRRAHPEARWAIKPLCLGLGALFAFDLYFFADAMLFRQFDQDIWVARGIASALVIPLIAVASVRNTGWTVDIHVSRSAVFHSMALLLSGAFVLAIAAAGYVVRYVGGDFGSVVQIAFSFAALLLAVLVVSSGRFHSKLRVFVSKHFFSYRYDYRKEWLRFTHTLSDEGAAQSVEERCIKALADLVESPAGILWLRQENDAFQPRTRWNAAIPGTAQVPAASSLPQFLLATGWIVNLDEYASHRDRYRDLVLPDWLASIPGAWLVVPLISGSELAGFVVLTTPRASVEVNWEVLDLLKTASRQAASYIGQARSTEALLEARKFAAFNRMSAFVVHDLKNLVAQLSLMLRNAERHRGNPEFQRDMVSTVAHVVGRMNHLMLQLRGDAVPTEKPRAVDPERLIRRVCAAKAPRTIALRLAPGLTALAHEDRLDHVLGHLVQNAIDATAGGGEASVALSRGAPGTIVIEVADTGVGMTPEFMRERLFKPFETTKASGMGIGMYESLQYVRGIGGEIDVRSTPDEGTVVRVTLPSTDAAQESLPAQQQAVT